MTEQRFFPTRRYKVKRPFCVTFPFHGDMRSCHRKNIGCSLGRNPRRWTLFPPFPFSLRKSFLFFLEA